MGVVFRQSIKTTLVILAGAVLGAVVMLGYSYVLTRQEMGFTRSLLAQASVLQYIVIFGTANVVLTYIQRLVNRDQQRLMLTYAAIVPAAVTLLLLVPYLLLKNQVIGLYQAEDRGFVRSYYLWIPILVVLWSYMTQVEIYLSSQHKTAISSFMREVVLKLLNIGLIALIWFHQINFQVFIIGTVLVYALPTLLMLPIAARTESFGFSFKWKALSSAQYKELAAFSWYHLLMGISVIAMGQVDLFMLGILSRNGLASLSAYTNAVFITAVMTAPYRAMTAAAYPTLNKAYISQDKGLVRQLFHRSAINTLIVSVIMAVIIACNLHNAVAILPKGKGFEAIPPLVLIMMLGRLVDMASGMNTELINMSEYYRFNFNISLLLLALLIGFNYALIPRFDIYGAAWGSTFALILFNAGKMIFLWKKMRLQPSSRHSAGVLFAGGLTAVAGYAWPLLPNPILDTFVRTGLVIIVYTLLLLWLKPSEDLRAYLQSVKARKRLF